MRQILILLLIFSLFIFGCGEEDDEIIPPPTDLKAELSGKAIKLTWQPVDGASLYAVHRKTEQDEKFQEIKASLKSTVYEDRDVTANVIYFYRVLALNDKGVESELSTPPFKIEYTESVLKVNEKELNFGSDKDSLLLNIKNDGKRDMDWKISAKDDWLTFEQKSGTLKGGRQDTIKVRANRIMLTPSEQDYISTITIEDEQMGKSEPVSVKIIVPCEPAISISPNDVLFCKLSETQQVTVKNTGSCQLSWHAVMDGIPQWLQIEPERAVTERQQDVTFKIDAEALPEFFQVVSVKFLNDGDRNDEATVTIKLKPPILKVKPSTVNFGESRKPEDVIIENAGCGILRWEVKKENNAEWLSVLQYDGTIIEEAQSVTLSVKEIKGLTGEQVEVLRFMNRDDSDDEISVTVKVNFPQTSEMYVEPTEITFNELPESHKITLENRGTGTLKWCAERSENVRWLNITPEDGTIQAGGYMKVTLTIKVSALQGLEGRQSESINFINEGKPDNTKSVSVEIEPPRLKIEPSEIEFCKLQSPQTVNLKNVGGCTLNWCAVMDDVPDWLEVKPDNAKTPKGQTQKVTVKINADKMDRFYQVATVKLINLDDSTNEGVLTINIKPPQLDVAPKLVDFGENREPQSVTVENTGCAILRWEVSKDKGAAWLDITPTNGRVIDEEGGIVLSITPESETLAGKEIETLKFVNLDNPDNEKTVTVKAVFKGKPELFISEENLDFGKSDKERTIEFKNIGTGVLAWEADISSPWLQIEPDGGEINEGQFVKISVVRDGLDAGDYNGKINITSNGGNKTIFIRLTVVGTIDGFVYDAISDDVVDDAQVTLDDVTFTHTLNGIFSLNYKHEGRHKISVEKPNYITTIMEVETEKGHLWIERLYLRPIPHRSGSVSNANFKSPMRVVFSVDGNEAYVTNELGNYVSVIDAISDSGKYDIPLKCSGPRCSSLGIAVHFRKPELYIANRNSDTVSIIELDKREDVKQILCASPTNLAVSSDGEWLYIVNNKQNSVSIVSLITRVKENNPIDVGKEPFDIAVSSNGLFYVTNWGSGDVSVIKNKVEIDRIDAGDWPGAIAISERHIYIAAERLNYVYVYNNSHKRIGEFPVPSMPTGIAIVEYNDGSEVAYVASIDGTITLIGMATKNVLDTTINVDNFAQDIAYNPILHKFYITCANGVVVLEF